jgi:hypothetical protein
MTSRARARSGPAVGAKRPEKARLGAVFGVAAALSAAAATALLTVGSAGANTEVRETGELGDAICGTWVLQQVSGVADLERRRPQIAAALRADGVTGLSVRVPWKAIDGDFAVLDKAKSIAAAQDKQVSVRFMAGRHTPARVFAAGAPYYLTSDGERVPTPFFADGSPNTVFEAAWEGLVADLAAWSRANGVRLLHLGWYGQDWAELNHGKEVRDTPGYSKAAWLNAHKRLVDIGARYAGADLAVELPLSGYGPLSTGDSLALAQHIASKLGGRTPAFYVQANGWGPNGEWGAPSAVIEAEFDEIWGVPVPRGLQMIQPEDYPWDVVFPRLYSVGATYAEVYLASFSGARREQLLDEVAAFAAVQCDKSVAPPSPTPTVTPTPRPTPSPSPPSDIPRLELATLVTDHMIFAAWAPIPDELRSVYEVYLDGEYVTSVSGITVSLTGLAPRSTHEVEVRAVEGERVLRVRAATVTLRSECLIPFVCW